MPRPAIHLENVSKRYLLGQFNGGTFRREAEKRLGRLRGGGGGATQARNHDALGFWALKDVSVSMEAGEVLGILGRNGAGKSTLLKLLSRVTEPTSGEIRIRGRVASLLEVGSGFHPELTGRENIYLNGAILGMSRAEIRAKFDEIVAFAEVDRFLDTPVKRYSSGMYVRLGFAVAAHLESEVLIVDEVLAVGDMEFQKKCLGKLEQLRSKAGRTVLFVSHNMVALEALCDRAIQLDAGTIIASGPTSQMISEYLGRASGLARESLAGSASRHFRSVAIKGRDGKERDRFRIGEDIVFEIGLYSEQFIEYPRCSITIHGPRGERLATLATDVQLNSNWAFTGPARARAVWRAVPLNVGQYRVDVSLWGYSHEIETLIGCKTLEMLASDVYHTGVLPDPSYQGYLVPDASWEIES